ncbi:carbon-nitrogen hydrolase family protein [Psychromonas ossibalaenae]|uniref:carbon-nitrogen hydrolase family protein n=1 Tax=Psychromonas ossibalaenae TaxID=444922 RepID=UPI000365971C|nr:carbon-nitrogen hydrolase family protein [Psychromonas ossibalaenae]
MAFNLCAVQMLSDAVPEHNLQSLIRLLAEHSPEPGELVLIPENALCFSDKETYLALAENLGEGYYQTRLAELAAQYQCYLVCGSFPIKSTQENKIYSTCLVFSPQGLLINFYHKMHLFDALVADKKGLYKESDTFTAGQEIKLFDYHYAGSSLKVGLAICYDLRFPALFQTLREQGASVILLPAAFTQVTGDAHWLPLLQARAIENQCYIVAANQGGVHACGRETYGHSMIISPWGEVHKELQYGEGSIKCEFNQQLLNKVRQKMPLVNHNRFSSSFRRK